ncbi:MAG TPA: CNNM domain-containing protein [Xanthobacteraceae bacterium]|nr:CNNM domain-containing protein [Xanthobacteraceae bacterium]
MRSMLYPPHAEALTWLGIALCVVQSALFSGLNLGVFSVSRLRLEVEAAGGNPNAIRLLELRKDSNRTLATILWGNVATNVLLTLFSESILAGVAAFFFSTFAITFLGEIVPQAYFSRHAMRMSGRLAPFLKFYRIVLFPIAKPTALFLNWWLGAEGIVLLKERDVRALITRHVGATGTEVGHIEATGAVNFLDLDDIPVIEEGEPVDPRSVIALPFDKGRPLLPAFRPTLDDPFLRRLDASGKKWVIFTDPAGQPQLLLEAHHFLRDVLFDQVSVRPEVYWHRPIVVTDPRTKLGDVIGLMKVTPEYPGDDVVDNDVILIWDKERRIITGADLLGRLLRGITGRDVIPPPKGEGGARSAPGRGTSKQ